MSAPQHAPMTAWPVVNDSLMVGGMPLGQLVQRVGSTPFYAYDRWLIEERVALLRTHLSPAIKLHYAIKANPMPALVCHIELGRYLVGEAGIYVCRVIERKVSRGQVFLITDGGMHHHLAASGNFGQIIRKNYPVVIGNRVKGEKREAASVVGPLCTPLDLLADRMELAAAHEGDLVGVFQSGAYGLTASPTAFLGHPPPLETLV